MMQIMIVNRKHREYTAATCSLFLYLPGSRKFFYHGEPEKQSLDRCCKG